MHTSTELSLLSRSTSTPTMRGTLLALLAIMLLPCAARAGELTEAAEALFKQIYLPAIGRSDARVRQVVTRESMDEPPSEVTYSVLPADDCEHGPGEELLVVTMALDSSRIRSVFARGLLFKESCPATAEQKAARRETAVKALLQLFPYSAVVGTRPSGIEGMETVLLRRAGRDATYPPEPAIFDSCSGLLVQAGLP